MTAVFPLPPNVQFISATSSQGSSPVDQDGVLSADLGAIAAGSSATVSVVVMPTAVGSIALRRRSAATSSIPISANNQATASVSVAPSVNMTVQLVPTPATVVAGRPLTFTATVANTGPDPATNVVLTLPMGPAWYSTRARPARGRAAGRRPGRGPARPARSRVERHGHHCRHASESRNDHPVGQCHLG